MNPGAKETTQHEIISWRGGLCVSLLLVHPTGTHLYPINANLRTPSLFHRLINKMTKMLNSIRRWQKGKEVFYDFIVLPLRNLLPHYDISQRCSKGLKVPIIPWRCAHCLTTGRKPGKGKLADPRLSSQLRWSLILKINTVGEYHMWGGRDGVRLMARRSRGPDDVITGRAIR